MLIFDDDENVTEIRDLGATEKDSFVTEFIVKNDTELAAKDDDELASDVIYVQEKKTAVS